MFDRTSETPSRIDSSIDDDITSVRVAPVHIQVFPERPDFLLVMVTEGAVFSMPPVAPPFSQQSVIEAMREAGIDARVHEAPLGRWAAPIRKTDNELRSQHALRAKEIALAALGDINEAVRERAALILRKGELEADVRKMKTRIDLSARGVERLSHSGYEAMKATLTVKIAEKIAVDKKLAALKQVKNIEGAETWAARMRKFRELVQAFLDPKDFSEICDMAFGGATDAYGRPVDSDEVEK